METLFKANETKAMKFFAFLKVTRDGSTFMLFFKKLIGVKLPLVVFNFQLNSI